MSVATHGTSTSSRSSSATWKIDPAHTEAGLPSNT
jgi:hypothetical protein